MLGWKQAGLKARIVNCADDFVILCVNKGQEAYEALKQTMEKTSALIPVDTSAEIGTRSRCN